MIFFKFLYKKAKEISGSLHSPEMKRENDLFSNFYIKKPKINPTRFTHRKWRGENDLFSNFYIKKPKKFRLASLAGNEGGKMIFLNFDIKKQKFSDSLRSLEKRFFFVFRHKNTKKIPIALSPELPGSPPRNQVLSRDSRLSPEIKGYPRVKIISRDSRFFRIMYFMKGKTDFFMF